MPGGTMNLISGGAGDLLLTGSPTQSFFKTTYNKYTPFGVQLFRLDYEGSRALSETRPTTMTFKVARYGDLLYDSYLVITMPAIYSDFRCSRCATHTRSPDAAPCCCDSSVSGDWALRQDYQFAWGQELGYTFIDEISVSIGGSIVSRMSGDWMGILKTLGRTGMDSILIDQMIGNTPDMIAPSSTNSGVYPTVPKLENRPAGHYPSIAGRTLYIPLGAWFTNTPSQAIPLVSLQYQEVEVTVKLRPLSHLYTIAVYPGPVTTGEDDCDLGKNDCGEDLVTYNGGACADSPPEDPPDTGLPCPGCPDLHNTCQKHLPTVPRGTAGDPCLGSEINRYSYPSCRIQEWLAPTSSGEDITLQHFLEGESLSSWNPDIHILARYVFLGDDERRVFAKIEQKYLINTATHIDFDSVDPSGSAALDISGIVSTYVWRFQRSDVALRNQWMNYTNYAYTTIPNIPYQSPYMFCGGTVADPTPPPANPPMCPRFPLAQESHGRNWNFYGIPPQRRLHTPSNERDIMVSASILLNGEVRESFFPAQVWNYVTKYTTQSDGDLQLGVYYYGYGLNDEIGDTQPSGALAMGKYTGATIQFTTLVPPLNDAVIVPDGTFVPAPNDLYDPCLGSTACPTTDAQREAAVAADNANAAEVCESWARASGAALGQGVLSKRSIYTYNLRVYIERYNVLVINSGMGGLQYAT